MFKKSIAVFLIIGMLFLPSSVMASDDSEIILKLLVKKGVITQQEVDEMRAEIKKEKELAKEEEKPLEERVAKVEDDLLSKVGLDKISSKLKLKGRWAAGYFNSLKKGSFDKGSFQAPEAKLQFTFAPDDINSVIMRMNLNNATFNNLDYFYLDTNLLKLTPWKDKPFTLASRIGRFKVDYGEETWSNNPVESVIASNSASNVSGNDEGFQLSGKIGKTRPLSWSTGVFNGNSGTGADNNWDKAFGGKLSYNLLDPLYISGSYYNSGKLPAASSSEIGIAGLSSAATNTDVWRRQMFEFDARYDFKKGKVLNPPAYCDSLAFIRAAYGHFWDDSIESVQRNALKTDREGNYGFVEGFWNVTKKFYTAARASIVDIDGTDKLVSLNSLNSNQYQRYSVGVGYRLTGATILKGEYTFNESREGNDADDSLISAVIASQF